MGTRRQAQRSRGVDSLRARALALGFEGSPEEFARSKDVDAIFWIGQGEELLEKTNFWDAVKEVNQEFEQDGLYITHLFQEDQIVLSPDWKDIGS